MTLIAIDLGNDMGIAVHNEDGTISAYEMKVTIKNMIDNIRVHAKNPTVITALPNAFARFMYKILINQSKQYGVLEHYFNTILIKENQANKAIIGKGRVTKEETMEEITRRGIATDTHNWADAAKFLLYYLEEHDIPHKAS